MAVYFANKIGAPGTGNSTPTTLAWSRHAADRKGPANGSPLVAVAFESGVIGVYTGAWHATAPRRSLRCSHVFCVFWFLVFGFFFRGWKSAVGGVCDVIKMSRR